MERTAKKAPNGNHSGRFIHCRLLSSGLYRRLRILTESAVIKQLAGLSANAASPPVGNFTPPQRLNFFHCNSGIIICQYYSGLNLCIILPTSENMGAHIKFFYQFTPFFYCKHENKNIQLIRFIYMFTTHV